MTTNLLRTAAEHISRRTHGATASALDDGQLLARFAGQADQSAFGELARRHGRMVLAACRRVLGDAHEAEDAAQAAFLILARKAGSLTSRPSVGGWLYGVALRVARQAERDARRRRLREARAAAPRAEPGPGRGGGAAGPLPGAGRGAFAPAATASGAGPAVPFGGADPG
ncbi:MAG TPA: sigma factor [Gemmataceae bacterium]